jgi:hypothetical protein
MQKAIPREWDCSRTPRETAMFAQHPMSGDPSWRQVMELESRKEVIKEWLSSPDIPSQNAEVLREMLATTERQLQAVRSQGPEKTNPSPLREAE